MSNTGVGPIYKRIIDAVVEASRNDFEENGVSTAVLESMREKWQSRLTSSDRAQFPWDPLPEPPQLAKAESNGGGSISYSPAPTNSQDANPPLKQESYDSSFLTLPPRAGPSQALGSQYASQRAAQLMQQQYGSQANESITALQAAQQRQAHTQAQQQQQEQQRQQQHTSPTAQAQQGNAPAYTTTLPYANRQNGQTHPGIKQEPTEQQGSGLDAAQMDGAGDSAAGEWQAVLAHRNAHGDHEPMGRLAIDQTIRQMIEQNAQRLEGGGLMVPLDQRLPSQRRARKGKSSSRARAKESTSSSNPLPPAAAPASQGFGGDMANDYGDEDDEDAINSELDDPDETADTTQEGVYEGDVILCLYDKVQRVKNKWKCVLRDGILTIDGKDYIFHKASGEFEW